MSGYLGESEEKLAQHGSARPAIIAKSTSKSKRIVAFFLGATLALGAFFARRSQRHKVDATAAGTEDHSVIVHVGTAYQGDMGIYIDALGTVTPVSTANIYSQVSGQVLAVHYREGQIVHRGDSLLDIDPRPYQAQLQQAEGLLDHDRGVLKQAEIDLARYREAFTSHAVAKQILDDQEQAVVQDQGAVKYDLGQVQENPMRDHITIDGHDGAFVAYIARPKASAAPAVVVLQELFGVNTDIRKICDELAEQGFLAVAPDLFWRQEPGVDLNVTSEADWQHGLRLYQAYDRDAGAKDVKDTIDAVRSLPDCNGKVAILGYCLGALMVFLTAVRYDGFDVAVAYHGSDTEKYLGELDGLTAPLLMHLAEKGEFISKAAQAEIKAALAKKPNTAVYSYPGQNHAFSRHGGARITTLRPQHLENFTLDVVADEKPTQGTNHSIRDCEGRS